VRATQAGHAEAGIALSRKWEGPWRHEFGGVGADRAFFATGDSGRGLSFAQTMEAPKTKFRYGNLTKAQLIQQLEEREANCTRRAKDLGTEGPARELERENRRLENENRELGKKLEARTAALREVNAEFEVFCSSVSHDLRAPLRIMRGFAEILLQDAGPKLSEEDKVNVQRIVSNAVRIDQLLNDLLAYGRVARDELHLVPVDLLDLVEDLVAAQRRREALGAATVEVSGESARVLAQPSLLNQALLKILENALRFVASGVTPIVRIRTEKLERSARVWVEDNGIGIAPAYHERVFSLFERLNREGYAGTGAGLAIAKRAVLRMDGRIGVDSQENQGSRFWIELPLAE
jgi:signal transduction histidine kinase